jgi:hypothetical protein
MNIATQVCRAIFSRRNIRLSRQLINGVAARMIRVLAAAVCLSELTNIRLPDETMIAESTPVRPILWKLCRN